MKKQRSLTAKQARFVGEYLVDLNATQAAIRSGYSPKTAEQQGSRLLRNAQVSSAVQLGQKKRSDRTEITADRVLAELGRIAFSDVRRLYRPDGTMKLPTEIDDETAAAIAGIDVVESQKHQADGDGNIIPQFEFTKKAKVFDKVSALNLAMKHLGMLTEKVEHSGVIALQPLQVIIEK